MRSRTATPEKHLTKVQSLVPEDGGGVSSPGDAHDEKHRKMLPVSRVWLILRIRSGTRIADLRDMADWLADGVSGRQTLIDSPLLDQHFILDRAARVVDAD